MALMLLPLALSHAYAPGTSTVRGGEHLELPGCAFLVCIFVAGLAFHDCCVGGGDLPPARDLSGRLPDRNGVDRVQRHPDGAGDLAGAEDWRLCLLAQRCRGHGAP